jgi:hypothetical protein
LATNSTTDLVANTRSPSNDFEGKSDEDDGRIIDGDVFLAKARARLDQLGPELLATGISNEPPELDPNEERKERGCETAAC